MSFCCSPELTAFNAEYFDSGTYSTLFTLTGSLSDGLFIGNFVDENTTGISTTLEYLSGEWRLSTSQAFSFQNFSYFENVYTDRCVPNPDDLGSSFVGIFEAFTGENFEAQIRYGTDVQSQPCVVSPTTTTTTSIPFPTAPPEIDPCLPTPLPRPPQPLKPTQTTIPPKIISVSTIAPSLTNPLTLSISTTLPPITPPSVVTTTTTTTTTPMSTITIPCDTGCNFLEF